MPNVRSRSSKVAKKKPMEVDVFPSIEGANSQSYGAATHVAIDIEGRQYEVERQVADYLCDLWQLLGSVCTRITDPALMISLKEETMPISKPKIVGFSRGSKKRGNKWAQQRVPLRKRKI